MCFVDEKRSFLRSDAVNVLKVHVFDDTRVTAILGWSPSPLTNARRRGLQNTGKIVRWEQVDEGADAVPLASTG
jgi:hypothetical protein